MENGALTGVKVIDLSRLLPGPYCSMVLADHGADVIAVEDKRFMADNFFLSTVNRNKRHMCLNLKTEKGKEIFRKLIADADILIEGFRPGVVDKLGVDYEAVCNINPRIIYCSISGYGQSGPGRNLAGHDVNYLARSGVLDLIGSKDTPPVIPGVQIADIAGGSMNAVAGILMALYARERTGRGQYVDISMTDGAMSLLFLPLFMKQTSGQLPERGNWMLSHRYACYNTYQTRDGRYIALGAVENRFWKNLCEHLGKPEFVALQYDEENKAMLIDFMKNTFLEKTLSQWEEDLQQVDACWSTCQSLEQAFDDPLFIEREMAVETPDGKTIGIPVKLSGTPGSVRTPPVDFGESTRDVLFELGYTDEEVKWFSNENVI